MFTELNDSLHYLKVKELKDLCLKLKLPDNGKKKDLINRILTFVKDGKILHLKEFPQASKAVKGKEYPLHPKTKMLYGNYRNDLKTRLLFKKIIDEHFHFTAYGIDWLDEQWHEGNPPSYEEFAKFWQNEYLSRQTKKANPKEEWAYIRFVQKYLEKNPKCSKKELLDQWEMLRLAEKKRALTILSKLVKL